MATLFATATVKEATSKRKREHFIGFSIKLTLFTINK